MDVIPIKSWMQNCSSALQHPASKLSEGWTEEIWFTKGGCFNTHMTMFDFIAKVTKFGQKPVLEDRNLKKAPDWLSSDGET